MNRVSILFSLLLALPALAGCGNNLSGADEGPLAVSVDELGPDTEDLVKDLPKGLVGDKENVRYTNDPLRGEDEEDG